jgi:arsenite methyltransferase
MTKIEFDDEWSRAVEAFNASPEAVVRRACILDALALKPGDRVLDVGSGPGHQVAQLSAVVGDAGRVEGVDPAEDAIEIARSRCATLDNVRFHVGNASRLPYDDSTFDAVMSSQVFEYLDDVPCALAEVRRVLKPRGRVLIHDTDWGTALWHSSHPDRTARIMRVWDCHLANPFLPRELGAMLIDAGFANVQAEALVQLATEYDESSAGALLIGFVSSYVVSQGVPQSEADAWASDLRELGARGKYFCSWNEYVFTADRL